MKETTESGECNRLLPPGACPWLVYSHGKGGRNQTFCTTSQLAKNSYVRSFRELRNKTVRASCHGWLVVSQKDQYSLWNLISLESIQLPMLKLNPNQEISECTLSSPPCDPSCTVLLFGYNLPLIIFCRLGDEEWTQQWYRKVDSRSSECEHLVCPVSCNGKVYALTSYNGKLVEIDQNKGGLLVFTFFPTKSGNFQAHSSRASNYMSESCGELFKIQIMWGGISCDKIIAVEISKLDLSTMVWIKVESAQDRAFFLDDDYAFSCQAIEPVVEGGRVLFTLSGDQSLYTFNIEDRSLLVSLPCPNLPTPWYSPHWVMPNFSNSFDKERAEGAIENEENESNVKQTSLAGVGEGCHLSKIPLDVLSLIAERLFLFDYMNFRAVCRITRLVAPTVKWRSTLIGSGSRKLSPWLTFREKSNGVCNFIDPKHTAKILMNVPDILLDATICYSKNAWSLYRIRQDFLFFWNSFTGKIIQLPSLPPVCMAFSGFGFSCVPMSSDCAVIGIADFHRKVDICLFCSWENKWHWLEFENNLDFRPNHNSPVYLNGAFYFLGQKGNLGVFEINEHRVTWEVLAKPQKPCKSFHENFLLECDGALVAVFVGHSGKWVRVFKLNHHAMTWVEVHNLGNHSLYVSRSSSFSAVVKVLGTENKIYFPRFHGNGIVYYSLDTRKYHTFENKDFAAEDFYDTREQLLCAWIEPKWV